SNGGRLQPLYSASIKSLGCVSRSNGGRLQLASRFPYSNACCVSRSNGGRLRLLECAELASRFPALPQRNAVSARKAPRLTLDARLQLPRRAWPTMLASIFTSNPLFLLPNHQIPQRFFKRNRFSNCSELNFVTQGSTSTFPIRLLFPNSHPVRLSFHKTEISPWNLPPIFFNIPTDTNPTKPCAPNR